jgi:formiminoglutamase
VSDDKNWPRASTWLSPVGRGPCPAAGPPAGPSRLSILGAPLRLGSITSGRCDLAPRAIRDALHRFSTYDIETDRDLRDLPAHDNGDLDLAGSTPEQAFAPLSAAVAEALHNADALVLLGGDNSITRAGLHGLGSLQSRGLLTLDAHLDLRDLDDGLTNGNPVRALLADGLPGRNIVQIGIQAFANSKAYFDIARDAGIHVITAEQAHARGLKKTVRDALDQLAGSVEDIYVDLDLDVLDRAFAPAAPGSRPGGFAPWELRAVARLCGAHPSVRVLDLVEIDPTRDIADTTILAAAACLLSFASGVLGGRTA